VNITFDVGQALFGLAALATAIFPILSWLSSRRNAKEIAKVDAKVDAVHVQGNSNAIRMEALAREAGEGAGNRKGREEQTAERKAEGI
jgi:hypothetical protein